PTRGGGPPPRPSTPAASRSSGTTIARSRSRASGSPRPASASSRSSSGRLLDQPGDLAGLRHTTGLFVGKDRASIDLHGQLAETAQTDRRDDALAAQLFAEAHGLPAMVASEESATDFDVHRGRLHGRCGGGSIAISGSRFLMFGVNCPTGCARTAATIAS